VASQKLNQLIGIKLLTSCVLENLGVWLQSKWGEMPVSPCRRLWSEVMTTIFEKFRQNAQILKPGVSV